MNRGSKDLSPLFPKNKTMNLQSRNADVSTVKALLKLNEQNPSDAGSFDQP